MKIAFDGRTADVANGTGIGTYTRSLIQALSRVERSHRYLVPWPRGSKFDVTKSTRFSPVPLSGHPRPEEDAVWLRSTRPEVYHLPQNGFNLPELPPECGLVITLHDLIPFLLPETVRSGYLHKFLTQVPPAVARADRVIAVSTCTAQALREVLGFPGERIAVIPNGLSRSFRPLSDAKCRGLVLRKYGLDGPYLLHVGGTNPRKNLESLIFAYSMVRKRLDGLPILAVAGSVEEGSPLDLLTRALGLGQDVRFLGYVAAKDLPYLYGASSLFVYPSLYEGFGLPPLEAMACGTPVVTADNSALPEVVGDAAISVDAGDVKALSAAIEMVWNDPALRESLRSRGIVRAGQFSWERSARETLRVYDEVAALKNPGRVV